MVDYYRISSTASYPKRIFSRNFRNFAHFQVQTDEMSSPTNSHSPQFNSSILTIPSPIITKRTRTASTSERTLKTPEMDGEIKSFCREKGHGFITPLSGGEDVFVHVSDIEGEYVPLPGDSVKYRLCPIPPKYEKCQAVHVHIVNLQHEHHSKWEA